MFFYDAVDIQADGIIKRYPSETMMIWDAEHGQYYGNEDIKWTHSWMHADGNWLRKIIIETDIPCNKPFAISDPTIIDKYLFALYNEVAGYLLPSEEIAKNIIHNFMLELARQITGEHQCIPHQFLLLKEYISVHIKEKLPLDDLARQVCLSVPYFCSQFKKYFGVSAGEYIINARLQNAAYLLHDTNLSIATIATQSGYHDIFHFSKQFKQYYRVSPCKYRQRLFSPIMK